MAVDGIISTPSLLKVKTIDNKSGYLNSNLVVSYSPSYKEDDATDILMLNGEKYTVRGTIEQLIENRYRRDARQSNILINLLA